MAKIGYIRVSSKDQNPARQEELLKDCEIIYSEKVSGKNTDRPELKKLLDFVRKGDVVVVESYSRLSRSLRDLVNLVDQLENKGVRFISLKENIDTSTPQGRLQRNMFASFAEFNRELILENQREGIAIKKAQGGYKGRQPIKTDWAKFGSVYDRWKAGEIGTFAAAKETGFKIQTFYRRVKEYEQGRLPI